MSPNVLERLRATDSALKAKDSPSPNAVILAAERAKLRAYSQEATDRVMVGRERASA